MKQNKSIIFWLGISLLLIPSLLYAYLLMPFPGSQELNAITVSYYLDKVLPFLCIAGLLITGWYLIKYFTKNTVKGKLIKGTVLILCVVSFYMTGFKFKADNMFKEPSTVTFENAIHNKVPKSFVIIGVINNGVAKAYPLVYLGYHHKIQDSVGNEAVLVTYCTMCRTGRVYSPLINGKKQNFRLVGARHYNAVIEDEATKTWWYQATGKAAVGKLKGQQMKELPYEQSTLGAWLDKHPGSLILQPDKLYSSDYKDLKKYDTQQFVDKDSTIKNKDTLVRKSWMLGLIVKGQPKAYDWRRLFKRKFLNDQVNSTPILITIEDDSLSYHAFISNLNGKVLHFKRDFTHSFTDLETASVWNDDGLAIAGVLKGSRLDKIQAYQEYWHSWKYFHPNTAFWKD